MPRKLEMHIIILKKINKLAMLNYYKLKSKNNKTKVSIFRNGFRRIKSKY